MDEAEPGQRGIEHLEGAVEDELAFDAHLELSATFLELPGVQTAMGGQTKMDAVVADQVLRPLRFRRVPQVGRCSDDSHAHVRPDAQGDHVLSHPFADSDAGVETLGDDVGQAIIDGDLDPEVWILPQELREFRP